VTCSDKGKPVERRGRKATGLKEVFLWRRGCHDRAGGATLALRSVGETLPGFGGRFTDRSGEDSMTPTP